MMSQLDLKGYPVANFEGPESKKPDEDFWDFLERLEPALTENAVGDRLSERRAVRVKYSLVKCVQNGDVALEGGLRGMINGVENLSELAQVASELEEFVGVFRITFSVGQERVEKHCACCSCTFQARSDLQRYCDPCTAAIAVAEKSFSSEEFDAGGNPCAACLTHTIGVLCPECAVSILDAQQTNHRLRDKINDSSSDEESIMELSRPSIDTFDPAAYGDVEQGAYEDELIEFHSTPIALETLENGPRVARISRKGAFFALDISSVKSSPEARPNTPIGGPKMSTGETIQEVQGKLSELFREQGPNVGPKFNIFSGAAKIESTSISAPSSEPTSRKRKNSEPEPVFADSIHTTEMSEMVTGPEKPSKIKKFFNNLLGKRSLKNCPCVGETKKVKKDPKLKFCVLCVLENRNECECGLIGASPFKTPLPASVAIAPTPSNPKTVPCGSCHLNFESDEPEISMCLICREAGAAGILKEHLNRTRFLLPSAICLGCNIFYAIRREDFCHECLGAADDFAECSLCRNFEKKCDIRSGVCGHCDLFLLQNGRSSPTDRRALFRQNGVCEGKGDFTLNVMHAGETPKNAYGLWKCDKCGQMCRRLNRYFPNVCNLCASFWGRIPPPARPASESSVSEVNFFDSDEVNTESEGENEAHCPIPSHMKSQINFNGKIFCKNFLWGKLWRKTYRQFSNC